MAYGLDTICDGLRGELQSCIVKINPTERGSERFTPRDPQAQGTIRDNPGRPRTFWLEPVLARPTNMGASTRRYYIDWALTIGYPAHGWETVYVSDFDDLRATINNAGGFSSVTGVGYRAIPADASTLAVERTADWLWATIRIVSVVETATVAKDLPNYQPKAIKVVTVAGSPATVTSFAVTVDGSAAWEYHVASSDTKTTRGGIIACSWDVSASSAVHYDESTSDIVDTGATYADTTGLVFNVVCSGGVLSLKATSTNDTWTVRTTQLSRS